MDNQRQQLWYADNQAHTDSDTPVRLALDLANELAEQHTKAQQQEQQVADLQARVAALQLQHEAETRALQAQHEAELQALRAQVQQLQAQPRD